MEVYIPYIEVMFFLTSLFAPANVDELRLDTQGQTLTIKVEDGNRWNLYLIKESAAETFIIGEQSVIRVRGENENKIPLSDYLSFPIEENLKEIDFRNGMKLEIVRGDNSITYIGRTDKTEDEIWKFSWESNQIKSEVSTPLAP